MSHAVMRSIPTPRQYPCTAAISFFFFPAEDGIRDFHVTGVQTCALPISGRGLSPQHGGRQMGEARRALVTGTSTGIGRAIALQLARDGYDLAVTEIDTDWLGDLLEHPDLQGRKVVPVRLDLGEPARHEQAFDRARDGLGDIDLLVNNAGRALHKPVVDVTWSEWDDVMNTNLKGTFFLS